MGELESARLDHDAAGAAASIRATIVGNGFEDEFHLSVRADSVVFVESALMVNEVDTRLVQLNDRLDLVEDTISIANVRNEPSIKSDIPNGSVNGASERVCGNDLHGSSSRCTCRRQRCPSGSVLSKIAIALLVSKSEPGEIGKGVQDLNCLAPISRCDPDLKSVIRRGACLKGTARVDEVARDVTAHALIRTSGADTNATDAR